MWVGHKINFQWQKIKEIIFIKIFLNVSTIIKPNFFVFENVRGILSAKPNGVKIFDNILKLSKKLGYVTLDDTSKMVFDTSDYGVPQTRKRVFVIGVKKKYSKLIPKILSGFNLRSKR